MTDAAPSTPSTPDAPKAVVTLTLDHAGSEWTVVTTMGKHKPHTKHFAEYAQARRHVNRTLAENGIG